MDTDVYNSEFANLERISNLTDVVDISTGWHHYAALTSDGNVWAWGSNSSSQLGSLATSDNEDDPVQVSIPDPVAKISAGSDHTLALTEGGTVWAWGANENGQLGNGNTEENATPAEIAGLTDVVDIFTGLYHNFALQEDGSLWAWGSNFYGQLGDGTTDSRLTPVHVQDVTDVATVAASYKHSVAVRTDGTVWTWGYNGYGQLGDGSTENSSTPQMVDGVSNVTAVAAGYHTVAISEDGSVRAWGANDYGQLGDGTTTDQYSPVQVIDADGEPFSVFVDGDNYESDDSQDEANPLTSGESQTHSIEPYYDQDWYTFTLTLSSSVTIETSGEWGDTLMTLYDEDLEEVASDDDSGEGLFSLISFDCDNYLIPGSYYIQMEAADGETIVPSYDILLQESVCESIDADGDGVMDANDLFPTDASEWGDNDGDGTGDNEDIDDDDDGMLDSYEETYGLDPNDPSDAELDTDGDGDTNLEESQFGSDPTDADDALVEGCDAKETFTDVSCLHWALDEIETMVDTSITSGCGDDNYCPDNTLQRSEMAIFLLRAKYGGDYSPAAASGALFTDVASDYWAGHHVERLADLGITQGCSDSAFCPSREITRSEMAIFLLRTKYGSDYQPPDATGEVFGDISSDYWAAPYIEQLETEGVVAGTIEPGRECDDGHYCPSQNINRAEMAVFLVNMFDLDADQSDTATLALVPQTGQTVSYDSGDDGDLQSGVAWPDPRFTDNADGTITDNLTGLVWLQDANCWELVNSGLSQVEALNAGTESCAEYTSRYSDWRLPSIRELQSLLDLGASFPALPEEHPFLKVQYGAYWSSTVGRPNTNRNDYTWSISMTTGYISLISEDYTAFVWPVRDSSDVALLATSAPETTALVAQTGRRVSFQEGDDGDLQSGVAWPDPRFTVHDDGTVTDNLTSLVWMQNGECWEAGTWEKALSQVAGLNYGYVTCDGYDGEYADWRLPSRNELLSFIDFGEVFPALSDDHPFEGVEVQNDGENYWSSTPLEFDPERAWGVDFNEGHSEHAEMTESYYAWPVRDGL
ncbi:MAG: DUF1566 domain-containing protein [Magnetococcales bacterium]|nr:DUF1566 domain-containing protein [Magnetococcales bacterium]